MPPILTVTEILQTIQGEGTRAGRPCALVRLTGCNLRCAWCDTKYAYEGGRAMSVQEVLDAALGTHRRCVLVTGGEPLLQEAAPALLENLCDAGCEVLLQTNGSRDISRLDPRVVRCVDVKCPGSGSAGSFLDANYACLRPCDEVNFVVAERGDYEFARRTVRQRDLARRSTVLFTPADGALAPAELAGWILRDEDLPGDVRMNLQLHKVIWPEARGGV